MIDALTLDQMRVLIAVADAGSFSAAARKLGRVQSAISQSFTALASAAVKLRLRRPSNPYGQLRIACEAPSRLR